MAKLKKLQIASSLKDLAELLDIPAMMLSYVLYIAPKSSLYTHFEIPKKHGGVRSISAPRSDLKHIQHKLSLLLQECLAEINHINGHKESVDKQGISHGFKKYHSIMTNGQVHVNRSFVFNIDLNDFFGTINFGRVRGFLIKDRNFNLNPTVATVIAQIACYTSEEESKQEAGIKGKLPQGSPSSPVISNLIGHILDISIVKLANKYGVTYSRYADDLTFSSNKYPFPEEIAKQDRELSWLPGKDLVQVIENNKFRINPSKTRMQYEDSRQTVTGLTVNRKVNVPVIYRQRLRSMLSRLFQTGSFDFVYKKNGQIVNVIPGSRSQLRGMLSYVDQVDQFNNLIRDRAGKIPEIAHGRVELFRRFIYYDLFYAAEQPVVICEGKTDNIYLKCAIKRLSFKYPKLIDPIQDGKLKLKFFKYSDRRSSVVTQITGGVGGICHFLKNYHADISSKFKTPIPKYPVIVIIDNDGAANSVYQAIAGITKKKKPAGKADFIHVMGNVYVVPTPFLNKNDPSCIEQFFDKQTLSEVIDGKKFSWKNGADENIFYSKTKFALQIVAKKMGTIDFTGFEQILDRMVKVLDDYEAKVKASAK